MATIFTEDEAVLLRARFPHTTAGVGRGKGPRATVAYALSGLVVCSECGSKLLGSAGSYKCQGRNGGCGKVSIRSWPVDEYVDSRLWSRREVNENEGGTPTVPQVDTAPLINAIQAGEARLAEAHEAYAAGELTLDDFKSLRAAIARRQEEAEEALRAAAPQGEPVWDLSVYWGELPEDEADFRARWERRELTPEEVQDLNAVFRRWIDRVIVTPALRRSRPPANARRTCPSA